MDKKFTAAVLTISTKGAKGEREDTSGPNLVRILLEDDYDVKYTNIISDDCNKIQEELLKLSDQNINLILTTGGTGFSKTDVTPEATLEVIERNVPGIPEIMRAKSFEITDRACLSRGMAGIRKDSLIINLPGSKKAAEENFFAVKSAIRHGLEILMTEGSANCAR